MCISVAKTFDYPIQLKKSVKSQPTLLRTPQRLWL